MFSVLVYSAIDYVFSCVQCVLLVDWRCFANVLWYCEFEIAPTLFRCVLEFRCGWLGWYACGRLKHNWSVHVECGGWGLVTVLNRAFVSQGICSGMSLPCRWRDWM